MSDIVVTGTIDIDPANREAAIAAAVTMQQESRKEDGCVRYVFSADLEDEGRFHLNEQWASQAAMDTHFASPHMAAFMGSMGGLGVTGTEITKWEDGTPSKLM